MRGRFITLEGVEGTGKSTQLDFVANYLRDHGHKVLCTREPGGTPVGEKIRSILLDNELPAMDAETELLLMFAARLEHVNKVIEPTLQSGTWVVSDRFYDASYAYQGYGRNVSLERIDELRAISIGELKPDLTILLDVSLDVSVQRVAVRGNQDRFENEQHEFHTKVRNGYLQLAEFHHERIRVVDATQSIAEVQVEIKTILDNLIQQH